MKRLFNLLCAAAICFATTSVAHAQEDSPDGTVETSVASVSKISMDYTVSSAIVPLEVAYLDVHSVDGATFVSQDIATLATLPIVSSATIAKNSMQLPSGDMYERLQLFKLHPSINQASKYLRC